MRVHTSFDFTNFLQIRSTVDGATGAYWLAPTTGFMITLPPGTFPANADVLVELDMLDLVTYAVTNSTFAYDVAEADGSLVLMTTPVGLFNWVYTLSPVVIGSATGPITPPPS